MGFLNPPKPTSPTAIANAQQGQNKASIQQGAASTANQYNPFYSLTWGQGEIDPTTGIARPEQSQTLSPINQFLLNQQQGTQGVTGAGLSQLMQNYFPQLSEVPDFSTAAGSLTNQSLDRFKSYMDTYFQGQGSDLDTRLRNQGLVPGDKAYDRAIMELQDNQARQQGNFINQVQPQAFQQAVQQYQTPQDTLARLFSLTGATIPGAQQTPTYSPTPTNMSQAYQTYDQQRQQQYQNMWSGIGSLASAAMGFPLGSAAGAVPTVGSTIGGGIGSLFS